MIGESHFVDDTQPSAPFSQVKLPVSPPWWELFGATLSEIKQVGNYILSLYSQPRLQWLEPVHPMAMVAEGEFHKLLRSPVPPAGGSTYPGAGTGGGSGNVTAAASPAGAMLPPSPVVVLSAAEDTPGAASKAKPEKVSFRCWMRLLGTQRRYGLF